MDYAMNEGDVLPCRQVARVVESRNSDYSKGRVCVAIHFCLRPDSEDVAEGLGRHI
jgi:NADPH-dependent curcumin reductase CurA